MKFHWKVLAWMALGIAVGIAFQLGLDAPAWVDVGLAERDGALVVESAGSTRLQQNAALETAFLHKGSEDERAVALTGRAAWDGVVEASENGEVVWVKSRGSAELVAITFKIDPASTRAQALRPFVFAAKIFIALLKMLIVPLVFTSIVTGVAGVGVLKDLGRLGGKTFLYYLSTSLLAIVVGQILVNLVGPGRNAQLGLNPAEGGLAPDESFGDILLRMVPENVFTAFSDNGSMLQIIFFALIFGFFVTRAADEHRDRMRDFFESAFQVMLRMAEGVLKLLPYGVFALMVRVVGQTGFSAFKPLLLYMVTVAAALLIHALVTLPLILRFVGRLSPRRWAQAMSPALMTAFSTSSSSATLPLTLETVEKRGKVSQKVSSFTLPLGATINMDGTALYECIGVIFLAQYYNSLPGSTFELTLTKQALVVMLALLASIGAAGIPSAGLVMMLTILSALGLPTEGAALLLAVDRPLDMMRTVVNVWSDSCGAAVIARSEGEEGPLAIGDP